MGKGRLRKTGVVSQIGGEVVMRVYKKESLTFYLNKKKFQNHLSHPSQLHRPIHKKSKKSGQLQQNRPVFQCGSTHDTR